MHTQIEQKSQEIAFALIRVAAYIRKSELKNRLDSLSFKFIQHVGEDDLAGALGTLNAIKNLIELGKHLLAIEPINSKILLREIELLSQVMRQSLVIEPLPDLSKMFVAEPEVAVTEKPKQVTKPNTASESKFDSEVAKIRQDRILTKIRQSNGAKLQLKDFIAEFPGISERTIRYDLKKLADEGKIERQGSGGPSNFYALKQWLSTGVTNA